MVIITESELKASAFASVNLFSSDLDFSYEKIINFLKIALSNRVQFQGRQTVLGLEDFMSVKEIPLTNVIHLSLFRDYIKLQIILVGIRCGFNAKVAKVGLDPATSPLLCRLSYLANISSRKMLRFL